MRRADDEAPSRAQLEGWMRLAIANARRTLEVEERLGRRTDVPIGAVVLDAEGRVIADGRNTRELDADVAGHAEIVAMRRAARDGSHRLDGCTLVVTLEPCAMCAGALQQAHISRLVFGAADPKAGCVGSVYDLVRDGRLPFATEVYGGVLAEECGGLITEWFRAGRARTATPQPASPATAHPAEAGEPG